MINADWDSIWRGKGIRKYLPQRFTYGYLASWECDLFLIILKFLPERGKVLSDGCGRGLIDYWLARVWGAEVHLLDSSKYCLQKVHRSFGSTNHYTYCHDALKLPFHSDTFDIVWNEGVWEHFTEEEIYRGVREMGRVCKRNGYIVVDVPYSKCKPYILAKKWLEDNNYWIYGYEEAKSTMKPYFLKAGLEVIDEYPIGSEQTCRNYINMIPDNSARNVLLKNLSEEDFNVYPHLVTIGRPLLK